MERRRGSFGRNTGLTGLPGGGAVWEDRGGGAVCIVREMATLRRRNLTWKHGSESLVCGVRRRKGSRAVSWGVSREEGYGGEFREETGQRMCSTP